MSKGLLITVCEGIKKPIFSEVQIVGLGKFSHIVELLGRDVSDEFESRGYLVSTIGYNAFTSYSGKVTECESNNDSEAHEQFHVLMKNENIRFRDFTGLASTYFSIFDESAATAINEYVLLKASGEEEVAKSVELKRKFGRETYDFMQRSLNLEEITEEEINEFADRSPAYHRKKNWASMFIDLKYFGLLDPCYSIVEKYGIEQGQKKLIGLVKTLRDESVDNFLKILQAESGIKIQKIKPIDQDLIKKGWIKYADAGDGFLNIVFSGPKEYEATEFCDIHKNAIAEYEAELDTLGELWMQVWTKELITPD
ncbi:MAG: hypothetical protein V1914_01600 [archaeon]